jgi:hypothetical protein
LCRYAQYSHFKIYSEAEYYKLEIDGYEGNAGDSLNDPWYGSNNSPFSTYNRCAIQQVDLRTVLLEDADSNHWFDTNAL